MSWGCVADPETEGTHEIASIAMLLDVVIDDIGANGRSEVAYAALIGSIVRIVLLEMLTKRRLVA